MLRNICLAAVAVASFVSEAAEPFLEADGLVVMEAESTESNLDQWQTSTAVSGYTGSGMVEFTGNSYRSGGAKSPLAYTFTITNGGVYRLVLRAATTRPASVPGDQGNDCFLKMAGDFTAGGTAGLDDLKKNQKYFTILRSANTFVWGEKYDLNNNHDFHFPEYDFKAGQTYTLTISGRSKSYSIDRIVLYRTADYSYGEAKSTAHPESSRSGGGGGGGGGDPTGIILDALDDFGTIAGGDIPYYKDSANDALAIDASKTNRRGPFARASTSFSGASATYDVTITTMTEEDGESTYRLVIDGQVVATYQNPYIGPGSSQDRQPHRHTWSGIEIANGATIAVESNAHTNGEIPEGNGTAWARGRWQQLELEPAGGGGGSTGNALLGQIIVDPVRGNYLVRNQDLDGDGALDPYMMAGVGGPEQFLYLGNRQADGTRSGGRQQAIIDELKASGVNGIYLQSIRSFGGDAGNDKTQAPFNDYNDPDSGLDPEIMAQWHDWFAQMRDADIGILFFIYDDHAKPWGSSGNTVPAGEQTFLTAITNEFEDYPNIIFVMAEEYQYAGFSVQRMSNMAAVVAAADDHDHAIGVHHNIGLANQYVGDPNIKVFVQQADLRNGNKMDKLHSQYGTQQGFDEQGRFAYIMGEGFGYHQNLVGVANKRDELRYSMYATAMAGGALTVFGAYEDNWGRDPITGNLDDMGHLVEFFHSTPFNTMDHNDALAHGDTDWVKAKVGERYIAYSTRAPTAMGVKGLPAGTYDLRWFDAKDGEWVNQTAVSAEGDTAFSVPAAMNNDTVVEIIRTGGGGGGGTVSRIITLQNLDDYLWIINPDGGTSTDDGSATTFEDLDPAHDHILTSVPSAGG